MVGCRPGRGGREMGGEDCEEQCANWSPILTGWNNILRGGRKKIERVGKTARSRVEKTYGRIRVR